MYDQTPWFYSRAARSQWCCQHPSVCLCELTGAKIPTVLTDSTVVVFAVLLFLSGYVLQQRTVESLHSAIRPRAPEPRHRPQVADPVPVNPTMKSTRPFGRLRDRVKLQSQLSAQDEPFDWSKLAYAQLVRDHSDVCNALIFFADLNRLRSPVPRLLLFPRNWIGKEDEYNTNPYLDTSRRLLKKASRRYRVILVPIDPVGSGSDGMHF
jgi:hypothetical protein